MTLATAPDFVRIPAGEFLMGAADAEDDERPVHRVFVSDFEISRYPIRNDDYAHFTRATGYPAPTIHALPLIAQGGRDAVFRETSALYVWNGGSPPQGHGNRPVVLVRYEDATAYCRWLSAAIGRDVRLPTEAQWEKAARGGVESRRYPWGDDIDPTRCNYLTNPAAKHLHGTRPAGSYPPNGYGLYDVIGNVWEWVSDWYAADYYGSGDAKDPRGPSFGNMRIVRGGSWVNDDVTMLRCAYRHKVPPDTYAYSIGFRVVCD